LSGPKTTCPPAVSPPELRDQSAVMLVVAANDVEATSSRTPVSNPLTFIEVPSLSEPVWMEGH